MAGEDASQRGHVPKDTITECVEGRKCAGGLIDQRLEASKSALLRRRTILGNCSRDLMWGDALRPPGYCCLLACLLAV